MPIYEYQCTTCGEELEAIRNLSDPPPVCPKCSGEMKKLLSAPAIQFKGSGWYKTDYANKSAKPEKAEAKSESSETKSEAKSETKSETKTTKSESKSE